MKELKDKGYFIMDGGVKSTDFFDAEVPSGCSSPLTLQRPRGALHGSMFPSEYRPAGQSLIKVINGAPLIISQSDSPDIQSSTSRSSRHYMPEMQSPQGQDH